jgi:hypothetical protein
VVYECLIGRPPFSAGDAVATCQRILRHSETLRWPADRMAVLSADAGAFMRALLTAAPARLGAAGGAAEVAAHPWLRGVDMATLRAQRAPYQPPLGDVAAATARLAALPRDAAEFAPAVRALLGCFDDIENLPLGDPRAGFLAGDAGAGEEGGGAAAAVQRKVVGYTYQGPRAPAPAAAAAPAEKADA